MRTEGLLFAQDFLFTGLLSRQGFLFTEYLLYRSFLSTKVLLSAQDIFFTVRASSLQELPAY